MTESSERSGDLRKLFGKRRKMLGNLRKMAEIFLV